ncbi:substrate-binding periplasmic protein [Hahella ganghwensis]|uniref:substrate-binding periplasmic protein n=1 Tax=Hahella ganghwensis TaxID=286420 RepID=UPI00037D5522|nr:transporter substrate-binding domain-containing protein [Hahella ganghwensis]
MRCLLILIPTMLLCSAPALASDEKPDNSPAKRSVVSLATLNWQPYVGEELESKGYVHELVGEAFKRGGYKPRIQFYPWARALDTTRQGKVDALFPEYYSDTRLDEFAYSDPFLGGPAGFYVRKDSGIEFSIDPRLNQHAALLGLSQYKFGVVRGYLNTDTFDKADFLYKEEVTDDLTNLQRLYHNRVQLIFIDKFVAEYLIDKHYREYRKVLDFLEPPLEIKYLYVAFSKKVPDYKSKLEAFNRGLQLMQRDGAMEKIYIRHGFKEVLWYEGELGKLR